jgi:hypothetical protein
VLKDSLFELVKAGRLAARRCEEASKIFGYKSGDAKDFEEVGENLNKALDVVVEEAQKELQIQAE